MNYYNFFSKFKIVRMIIINNKKITSIFVHFSRVIAFMSGKSERTIMHGFILADPEYGGFVRFTELTLFYLERRE